MPTRLSPHFTVEELTATQHRRLDNTPSPAVLENLRRTAERMEQVRSLLGDRVITVSSGYRSPAVNRAVGGAKTSAHLSGLAVDFNCHAFGSPAEVCEAIARSSITFDQLIEEGRWVHLSADPRGRRQVLTKRKNGGYRAGLGRDPPTPGL
ncbi:D-Ala-D-Ala carboxypeptidase family metallohydrolase [Phenylobacterium sp.]|uniref:D-Ala-D-Ala carboxypeptidase family metallohydrolase n=1 Tax=Phenylobacterium sp. TaxID=1871053 RepID=UPI0027367382|nr:D-Ala-D-Ala carboxypeptidase family metallohydrolase [Phenylobacterium sp.]MDP3854398.1 D-Ala-D-Ala carboxypeptidase family metallohydrolase [Phenylobacterium sp.]